MSFSHPGTVAPGGPVAFASGWENLGVAPPYNRRTLTYRLRGEGGGVLLASPADTTAWLPGPFEVRDVFAIPGDLPPGTYRLEVALVDRAGTEPETAPLPPLRLAIRVAAPTAGTPCPRSRSSPEPASDSGPMRVASAA